MGEAKRILAAQDISPEDAEYEAWLDDQERKWQEEQFQAWLLDENYRDCQETRRLWRQNGWRAV